MGEYCGAESLGEEVGFKEEEGGALIEKGESWWEKGVDGGCNGGEVRLVAANGAL